MIMLLIKIEDIKMTISPFTYDIILKDGDLSVARHHAPLLDNPSRYASHAACTPAEIIEAYKANSKDSLIAYVVINFKEYDYFVNVTSADLSTNYPELPSVVRSCLHTLIKEDAGL